MCSGTYLSFETCMSNLRELSETILNCRRILLFYRQLFLLLLQLFFQHGHWVSFLRGLNPRRQKEGKDLYFSLKPKQFILSSYRRTAAFGDAHPVPGILNDADFLRQDLDESVRLSLTEHHAVDGGNQSLIGQVQRSISSVHHCKGKHKNESS